MSLKEFLPMNYANAGARGDTPTYTRGWLSGLSSSVGFETKDKDND